MSIPCYFMRLHRIRFRHTQLFEGREQCEGRRSTLVAYLKAESALL
ncbi:MAG: hypothetical protein JWN13_6412, partial [Betaproteobacteria bacterium]|nr:hypothetical protein [Betaproteobacteria bacterium]